MGGTRRALTHARRDAGLRRLRVLNRFLVGAAVIGSALLTDVAAKAFPGHKRVLRVTSPAQGAPSLPTRHRQRRQAPHHRHAVHHMLSAPAHTPAATTPAPAPTTTSEPPPTTTQAAAPAPAPAPSPAPVVSGGS